MRRPCGCVIDDETGAVTEACPDQDKQATAGRKPCGCCVAVTIVPDHESNPDEFMDYGREIRRWKAAGMTIEHRTVGWVRHTSKADGGLAVCEHSKRKQRQLSI